MRKLSWGEIEALDTETQRRLRVALDAQLETARKMFSTECPHPKTEGISWWADTYEEIDHMRRYRQTQVNQVHVPRLAGGVDRRLCPVQVCESCRDSLPTERRRREEQLRAESKRRQRESAEAQESLSEAQERLEAGDTLYWCPECSDFPDEADLVEKVYECGECGEKINGDDDGHRCEDCNRFASRCDHTNACPECLGPTQEITDSEQLASLS